MFLLRCKQQGIYWMDFKRRNLLISSTDMASVFCLKGSKSRRKLFLEKKGISPRQDFKSEATEHGRKWERVAIGKVIDNSFPSEDWRYLRPGCLKDPPVCCSPDLVFVHRNLDLEIGLEVKCPFSAPIPLKKEDIPTKHLLQAFSCLMVLRADRWLLAFYDSETDRVKVYEIFPDSSLWEELLKPAQEFLSKVADSSASVPPKKGKEEKELEKKISQRLVELTNRREDLE